MKILADFYLYNYKKENIEYNINTNLSLIISNVHKFIKEYDKEMDFNKLVTKWNELNVFLEQYGDIPLFKLLRIQKKYKICYGGYIKFRIVYNKIEQMIIFQCNDFIINNKNHNAFYSIYNQNQNFLYLNSSFDQYI